MINLQKPGTALHPLTWQQVTKTNNDFLSVNPKFYLEES
jgi:hypothetical protein